MRRVWGGYRVYGMAECQMQHTELLGTHFEMPMTTDQKLPCSYQNCG